MKLPLNEMEKTVGRSGLGGNYMISLGIYQVLDAYSVSEWRYKWTGGYTSQEFRRKV